MSNQAQILILLLFIAVVAAVLAIWQLANMRGYKTRGRRRVASQSKSERHADKRNLSAPEKRLYKEAQRMLRENKIPAAARIFEQLGMPREAIQCLEDAKMIHEAASILLRMQRHNRAGVIFARHGMWADAAQCFKTANMPAEAAKCFREAGKHGLAGTLFEAAGRHEDAATSFELDGEFLNAARILFMNNMRPQSLRLYSKAATSTKDVSTLNIRDDELDMLVAYVAAGNDSQSLIKIIVGYNRIPGVLLSLLNNNNIDLAAKMYTKSKTDIGPGLMAETNYGDDSAKKLAEMFLTVSNFDYAGRVLERLEEFKEAAEAFEKGEEYERASYCYERSGNSAKVRDMKKLARSNPAPNRHGNKGFALSSVTEAETRNGDSGQFDDGNDESTAVIHRGESDEVDRREDDATSEDDSATVSNEIAADAGVEIIEKVAVPQNIKKMAPVTIPEAPKPLPRSTAEVSMPTPEDPSGKTGNFSLSDLDDDGSAKEHVVPARPPPIPVESVRPGPMPLTAGREGSPVQFPTPINSVVPPAPSADVHQFDEGKSAFHRAKFFADLDFRQKNKLWDIGKTQLLKTDETVLSYNDEPEGIYVILSGTVSCFKHVKDQDSYVDQMGEAESFGELWLLADQPTTVRFVASSPTAIRIIDRSSFNELLDSDGSIARKLYKRFTMRLLKRLLKPQNPNKNQAAS